MIKHIVMWNLKEEAGGRSKTENLQQLREVLEALPAAIPEIIELEVGFNVNPSEAACDVGLYTSFASLEDLDTYQKHPEHQKVVMFVKEIVSDRHVVDYETGT